VILKKEKNRKLRRNEIVQELNGITLSAIYNYLYRKRERKVKKWTFAKDHTIFFRKRL